MLLREGESVALTSKLFDILLLLVENNGRVLEKERLMREVWPGTFVKEGNLTQNIPLLGKALTDDGHQYIQTVPRRGYRFVGQSSIRAALSGTPQADAPGLIPGGVLIKMPRRSDSG